MLDNIITYICIYGGINLVYFLLELDNTRRRKKLKEEDERSGRITVVQPNMGKVFFVLDLIVTVIVLFALRDVLPEDTRQARILIICLSAVCAGTFVISYACAMWRVTVTKESVQYRNWLGIRREFPIGEIDECRINSHGVRGYYSKGKKLFSLEYIDTSMNTSLGMNAISAIEANNELARPEIRITSDKTPGRDGVVRLQKISLIALSVGMVFFGAMAVWTVVMNLTPAWIIYLALAAFFAFETADGLINKTWAEKDGVCCSRVFKKKTRIPYEKIKKAVYRNNANARYLDFYDKDGKRLLRVVRDYTGYPVFEKRLKEHHVHIMEK
jgi:hypothetical protein